MLNNMKTGLIYGDKPWQATDLKQLKYNTNIYNNHLLKFIRPIDHKSQMVKIKETKLHSVNKCIQLFNLDNLIKHFIHVSSLPARKAKNSLKYISLIRSLLKPNSNSRFKLTFTLT
ncbi:hypothetical protein GCM10009409_09150 [Shewanella saliphila]|uniref:Uncharacterized protein n=1 Tax=Shewanella saliphila TaxID=2282698 RepID=A0ABQ2Q4Z1_9GAMM|nr:hypothetical protein GCM10009409_09150 [Shewanella saliphila]